MDIKVEIRTGLSSEFDDLIREKINSSESTFNPCEVNNGKVDIFIYEPEKTSYDVKCITDFIKDVQDAYKKYGNPIETIKAVENALYVEERKIENICLRLQDSRAV